MPRAVGWRGLGVGAIGLGVQGINGRRRRLLAAWKKVGGYRRVISALRLLLPGVDGVSGRVLLPTSLEGIVNTYYLCDASQACRRLWGYCNVLYYTGYVAEDWFASNSLGLVENLGL